MPWLLGGLGALLFVALSVGGLHLVHSKVPHSTRQRHNELAGFIYAVVGVLYAVLLALVVIAVWEGFAEAEEQAAVEAGIIGSIYRDSEDFPEPFRMGLRERLVAYAESIERDDWPAMERGEKSEEALRAAHDLWSLFREYRPQDERELAWYSLTLSRLDEMSELRELRLHASSSGLPTVMWVVLLAGAVITIGFSFLFGTENFRAHVVMVAALSAMIAVTLVLVWSLEFPYRGIARVEPTAFGELTETIGAIDVLDAALDPRNEGH